MSLDTNWALDWARRSADTVRRRRGELIELDREIGDGDHGTNLDRGFRAVVAKLDEQSPSSPADVLKTVAMSLISTVGGASGPLFGTAFLRASGAVQNADILDAHAVVALLTAARDGIAQRGNAQPGDKTMIDAWTPAVDAAGEAAAAGADAPAVLRAAAEAARAGAESTDPLVARKGRASYLGERAIGHRDPGAQSTVFLLEAAADAAGAPSHSPAPTGTDETTEQ